LRPRPLFSLFPPTPNSPHSCPFSNTIHLAMTDVAMLNSVHAACFEEYLSGRNVGIFACAGLGKSVLLRAIIRDAGARGGPSSVAVCSWYGAAADLVGGSTLNSFFVCGIWLASPDQFLTAVKAKMRLAAKLKDVRVLFIDEVFTITAGWFIVYLKLLRGLAPAGSQQHTAGGVQVICTLMRVLFYPFVPSDSTHRLGDTVLGVGRVLTVFFFCSVSPDEALIVAGDPMQTLPVDLSNSTSNKIVFQCLQRRSLFQP